MSWEEIISQPAYQALTDPKKKKEVADAYIESRIQQDNPYITPEQKAEVYQAMYQMMDEVESKGVMAPPADQPAEYEGFKMPEVLDTGQVVEGEPVVSPEDSERVWQETTTQQEKAAFFLEQFRNMDAEQRQAILTQLPEEQQRQIQTAAFEGKTQKSVWESPIVWGLIDAMTMGAGSKVGAILHGVAGAVMATEPKLFPAYIGGMAGTAVAKGLAKKAGSALVKKAFSPKLAMEDLAAMYPKGYKPGVDYISTIKASIQKYETEEAKKIATKIEKQVAKGEKVSAMVEKLPEFVKKPARAVKEGYGIAKETVSRPIQKIFRPNEEFYRKNAQAAFEDGNVGAANVLDMYGQATKQKRELFVENINDGIIVSKAKAIARGFNLALFDRSGTVRRSLEGLDKAQKNLYKEMLREGKMTREEFIGAWGNYKDFGHKTIVHLVNSAGAPGEAKRIVTNLRNQIFKGTNRNQRRIIDTILQSERTIEVASRVKQMPGGRSVAEHQEALAFLKKTYPKDYAAAYKKAERVWMAYREALCQFRDEGLISAESFQNLLRDGLKYNPREIIERIDPLVKSPKGGGQISIHSSGLKAITDKGTEKLLNMDSFELLQNYIGRMQSRIFKNRAAKSLHDVAVNVPNNGIVRRAAVLEKTPADMMEIAAMVKGKPAKMFVDKKFAKEWILGDPETNTLLIKSIGWLSGAVPTRAAATVLNPLFAVANLFRDVQHIYMTLPKLYHSNPIVFAGQMLNDLNAVKGDLLFKRGLYVNAIKRGMDMDYLTQQGVIQIPGLRKLTEVMGSCSSFSEKWTRLAIVKRCLRKDMGMDEAVFQARNYLDFNQGGWFTKALNNGIPFFNVGFLATRGLARAARQSPVEFAKRLGYMWLMSTGTYYANRMMPECYRAMPHHFKENYLSFCSPWVERDEHKDLQYYFFTLPMEQTGRLFHTFFTQLSARMMGDTDNFDVASLARASRDILAVTPESVMPTTLRAALGYGINYDFWRNEEIWKGWKDIKPSLEVDKSVHPFFQNLGKSYEDLSPKRFQRSMEMIFTRNNPFISMVGYGYKKLFDAMPEEERYQTQNEMLTQLPLIRSYYRKSSTRWLEEEAYKGQRVEERSRLFVQNKTIDEMADDVTAGGFQRLQQYVMGQPVEDRQRLVRRYKTARILSGVPNRSWILTSRNQPEKVRAQMFFDKWRVLDSEGRTQLFRNVHRSPGYLSNRFKYYFNRLRTEAKL